MCCVSAGSVIVVTGASSGIGKEISLIYAARKCKLVLAARQKEGLDEVAAMCRRLGSEALVVPTDVTKESDCKNLMQAAVATFGCIDILVLNAGVGMHNFFHQTEDLSLYRKLMDINYFGYLYCTKYAYTALKQSKGKIVVVSSVSGEMGLPYRTAYCASKFAITGFFEALRAEMDLVKSIGQDESPIKITIVCPPTVSTNLRKNSLTTDPAFTDIADKGALSPAQVAAVIVDAADKELRKVFFPFSAFFGVYVRPFFPDFVDFFAQRKAKL
jgi:short-subunit dehydrogenase